jgi:lysophospholipase L1-like esterase
LRAAAAPAVFLLCVGLAPAQGLAGAADTSPDETGPKLVVYRRVSFDAGPEGWDAAGGGRVRLTGDAVSGKALHVECTKSGSGARLLVDIEGSAGLKMAFLTKGQKLTAAGVNVYDRLARDNTTPYGYRYFREGGWTPVLYQLDRFRYNSQSSGYVGPKTAYGEVRFYGPPSPEAGAAFTLDDFVLYRGEDRLPPEKPLGLEAQASAAGVRLSWRPPHDDVGVQGYAVARSEDGVRFRKIAESVAPAFLDREAPGASAHYRVLAFDFEENLGPWSDSLAVQGVTEAPRPALSREASDRVAYARRVKAAHARGAGRVRKGHAVLFGDSLTGASVYPHCAEAAFGTLTVAASGYAGTRTDFGRRAIHDLLRRENPEFVFVLFGTNNGKTAAEVEAAMADLEQIAKACDEHGTVAVLGTIPPRGWEPASSPEARYNARLVELCGKKGIPVGYIFEAFQAAGDRRGLLDADGVHWRLQGMELAARAWAKTLEQVRFVLRDRE